MKRKVFPILLSLVLLACFSCATTTVQLTKDQEARILLNGIQVNLSTLFDTAKALVVASPKYQDVWKNKVNPAFDLANKTVKDALDLAKKGQYTPADIQAKVNPFITRLIVLLAQEGIIK